MRRSMNKVFVLILMIFMLSGFSYSHHGTGPINVLDTLIEQSIYNYNLTIDCKNILDGYCSDIK